MIFRQIPKRYLIHKIKVDGTEFTGVRIDNQNKMVSTEYGQVLEAGHLMFVDIKNTPKYKELKELLTVGTTITWNDRTLSVRTVETLFTDEEHHLEVGLT